MNQTPSMIDLSLPITEVMRVYPGMATPSFNHIKRHETHGVQVSKLEIVVHAGTHVDAPRHFLAHGSSIDQIDLDKLAGSTCPVWRPAVSSNKGFWLNMGRAFSAGTSSS